MIDEPDGVTIPPDEEGAEIAASLGEIVDVRDMRLQLDKDESLRAVALMLGTRYYTSTIIKDAAYLDRMIKYEEDLERRNDKDRPPFHLRPASIDALIRCCHEMEMFLRGESSIVQRLTVGGEEIEAGRAKGEVEGEQ